MWPTSEVTACENAHFETNVNFNMQPYISQSLQGPSKSENIASMTIVFLSLY